MTTHTNGSIIPAFDSYDSIEEYIRVLKASGVTPDSIIILNPPPPPPSR